STFDHQVAALDVTEVTQSLAKGILGHTDISQVADPSDLACVLGRDDRWAKGRTEDKGEDEGKPRLAHRRSGSADVSCSPCRIGLISLGRRPRSLTRIRQTGVSGCVRRRELQVLAAYA